LESKRKLNTEASDKNEDDKKFKIILRKREEALAKKMKGQLNVKPKQLFFQ